MSQEQEPTATNPDERQPLIDEAKTSAPIQPVPVSHHSSVRSQDAADEVSSVDSVEARFAFYDVGVKCRISHMLMSCGTIFVFIVALVGVPWRLLRVDREALLAFEDLPDNMDMRMLNDSIFFTRSQGIYTECLLQDSRSNSTDELAPPCEGLLQVDTHNRLKSFWILYKLFFTLMILGPVVIILAIIATIAQAHCYWARSSARYRLHCFSAWIRALNTLLGFAFIIVHIAVNNHYRLHDPNYPVSWPIVVRKHTHLEGWQAGPMVWFASMGMQIIAIILDLVLARCFLVPLPLALLPRQNSSPIPH